MKQINIKFKNHKKSVYNSYELVYNKKVSLHLCFSVESEALDV